MWYMNFISKRLLQKNKENKASALMPDLAAQPPFMSY